MIEHIFGQFQKSHASPAGNKYGAMDQHPHILLKVTDQLDPGKAKSWLRTVQDTLPSGVLGETIITKDGQQKTSRFYAKRADGASLYVVPLTRDLRPHEAGEVARAWHEACPQGDFEIDYSTPGIAGATIQDTKVTGLREVAMEAAKLEHAEWIKGKQQQGWSYGIKMDHKQKRDPRMLPWERLSPRYQIQGIARFDKLMEVLGRMDLRLVRNRR